LTEYVAGLQGRKKLQHCEIAKFPGSRNCSSSFSRPERYAAFFGDCQSIFFFAGISIARFHSQGLARREMLIPVV
jgi:hypothetical protein